MSTTLALVGTVVEHVTTTGGIKTSGGVQALAGPVHAMANPFTDIVPNFTILGADFNALWKKVFGAVWAGVLVWVAIRLIMAIGEAAQHKGGGHPQQLAESRGSATNAAMVFGAVVSFGVIMGVVFAVLG